VLSPSGTFSGGALNQAQKIINNRVNGLGVAGATVQKQGNNIVVELPGVKNASAALATIGQTAQLQFRPVLLDPSGQQEIFSGPGPSVSAGSPTTAAPATTVAPAATTTPAATATTPAPTPTTKGAAGGPARVATAAAGSPAPAPAPAAAPAATAAPSAPASTAAAPSTPATAAGPAGPGTPTTAAAPAPSQGPALTPASVLNSPDAVNQQIVVPLDPQLTKGQVQQRYVLGPVIRDGDYLFTGQIVSSAQANIDQTGQWTVGVNFTGKGGSEWDKIVGGKYYQQYVAIVLDNKVESAPQIQAQRFNGQASISGGGSGGFTHSQASNLALVLRYGALPVRLTQSEVRTVSASLGKASLRAGLIAGFIGLGLVLLYMILYYRALGIVVVVGLGLSASLLYSLYTWLGTSSLHASLSLASVVGIIVSVGVTADSYIVYFERLKDDIRAGKSVRTSVDRSFGRAWRTIWTADLVSMIAAFLLYVLTIGDVRGFAFSLGLATVLDLITAYLFTRPIVFLLGRNRTIAEARWLGISRGLAAVPVGGAA
ncbi:MAG TPA: protein translocase subunit SecD, partial [Acidimicrobiales bacterium]|nr:protein translocase subunit SecD [Acidimicrobiales bacterium]